jgi:hypothetical protein
MSNHRQGQRDRLIEARHDLQQGWQFYLKQFCRLNRAKCIRRFRAAETA